MEPNEPATPKDVPKNALLGPRSLFPFITGISAFVRGDIPPRSSMDSGMMSGDPPVLDGVPPTLPFWKSLTKLFSGSFLADPAEARF